MGNIIFNLNDKTKQRFSTAKTGFKGYQNKTLIVLG